MKGDYDEAQQDFEAVLRLNESISKEIQSAITSNTERRKAAEAKTK